MPDLRVVKNNLRRNAVRRFTEDRKMPNDVVVNMLHTVEFFGWGISDQEVVALVNGAYQEAVVILNQQ